MWIELHPSLLNFIRELFVYPERFTFKEISRFADEFSFFEESELWDLVDESLRRDQDLISEIGVEYDSEEN